MIEDFHSFEDGACVAADVCIIGAGAAGITLAREFLGTRHRVVLLESGGLDKEEVMQALNVGEVAGLSHGGMEKGRVRAFGGTTVAWGRADVSAGRLRLAAAELGAEQRMADHVKGT